MFNRTSEYFAHGPRAFVLAPVPVLRRLRGEQRKRLEKSSRKVGKVLGETPIVDIIPDTPRPSGTAPKSADWKEKRGRRIGRSKKAPPAPVLRYKIPTIVATVVDVEDLERDEEELKDLPPPPVPRKDAPASLDLPTPIWRAKGGMLPASQPQNRSPGFLSPLSPLSPISPIETADMRSARYHGLRRLARASRAFRDTIVEELPTLVYTGQPVDAVNTYLDLYRISTRRHSRLSQAYTACSAVTPHSQLEAAYTACSVVSRRRRSSSLSILQRKSMTPTARASFIVPHSATPTRRMSFLPPPSAPVASTEAQPSRYTLLINVPSPRSPTARVEPHSVYSATSTRSARMSYTIVLTVPRTKRASHLPDTPADDEAPLQKQQRAARARTAIAALALSHPPPVSALPSPPTGGAPTPSPLAAVRSPRPRPHARAPYWVHAPYRLSVHPGAGVYVRRSQSYARKSAGRAPPVTPRTMRRERRQGWGGEWGAGRMGTAVEGLKGIKTPAPRVPEKDVEVVELGEAH